MANIWNDDLTQSIASTVSDVLEGKAVKKEDVSKYIKSNSTGGFDVVDAKENVVKSFGKRNEAEGYALKNLARLAEVEEPKSPDGKNGPQTGEKDFKGKHKTKKSGEKEDGTVMKEEEDLTISIDYMHKIEEKLKPGRGKATLDIDYIGDKDLTKKLEKKFKIKFKQTGQTTADVTGDKKALYNFMRSDAYMMDDDDIKDLFPQITEGYGMKKKKSMEEVEEDKENGYVNIPVAELSDKQKEYQKVFKMAMKKFGVKSPADFKDEEKKKEFFDFIDKNYKAKEESD